MKKRKTFGWCWIFFLFLLWLSASLVRADGGYVSRRSVAVSTDQRAILIKNGNEISMTLSTGYTGEGEDFGWIIPTPVAPAIEDVSEAGENGEKAFKILDEQSAPEVYTSKGGCFPSGTEVLTASGPRAIETLDAGTRIYTCDLATGEWVTTSVRKRLANRYEGDLITIQMGQITTQATGNQPFYVLRGDRLGFRPFPQDIPKEEQRMTDHGRWVEARNLKEGDVLQDKSGNGLMITGLSSRHERIEVYNLDVENYQNYAVHQKGILVHNKGGKEGAASIEMVKVYGKVTLEHYEVSILGAAAASALLRWLQENGYQVNPVAQGVLDGYIEQNWAFVAVKLNPSTKRHYENELLPPLTIRYQYDHFIYPLRISSVSTTQTARIALYVIAQSTVFSSNYPTSTLKFRKKLPSGVVAESYVEACIRKTIGREGRRLVVMYSGWSGAEWTGSPYGKVIKELMKTPFSEGQVKTYLTRLETRVDPMAMTEDITLALDPTPREFRVYLAAGSTITWGEVLLFFILAMSVFGFVCMVILVYRGIRRLIRWLRKPPGSRERDKVPGKGSSARGHQFNELQK